MVRDEACDYPETRECEDKSSDTISEKFLEIYQEDLKQEKMKSLRTDNGSEFTGEEFQKKVAKAHKLRLHKGLPRRSTTNSKGERFYRTAENGTKCSFSQSKLHYVFWGLCLSHWLFNYVAAPREDSTGTSETGDLPVMSQLEMAMARLIMDGKNESSTKFELTTAYEKRHKRRYNGAKLVVFGTKCYCLCDNIHTRKWEPRGRVGCIVGYGRMKPYKILDVNEHHHSKNIRITLTRDVKIVPNVFPIKDEGMDVLTRNMQLTQELYDSL